MAKNMKKYQVIGGQYESYWYGESDSLLGAKQIAARHDEYHDNWQGWHRPRIYLAEDVEEVVSWGRITSYDNELIRVPVGDAAYAYDYNKRKWFEVDYYRG